MCYGERFPLYIKDAKPKPQAKPVKKISDDTNKKLEHILLLLKDPMEPMCYLLKITLFFLCYLLKFLPILICYLLNKIVKNICYL